MSAAPRWRIALTGDFLTPRGTIGWGDIGLGELDARDDVEYFFLEDRGPEIEPDQLRDVDALISLLPRISASSLLEADRLRVIARFGVGYDSVDIAAATANGTVVTLTRDAVGRVVPTAALALILGVTHRLREKDGLVRSGRWEDRLDHMGTGLTGKTLGFVGWGTVGRGLSELIRPFGMTTIAYDPWADLHLAAEQGLELVSLEDVACRADIVVVMAALTESSRGLVGEGFIGSMKESAFLVNMARGPLVDADALAEALHEGRIAGAASDVFDPEPFPTDHPLLSAPNTLFTPHAASWTDEGALATGSSAIRSALAVLDGARPTFPVNPEALERSGEPWARGASGATS